MPLHCSLLLLLFAALFTLLSSAAAAPRRARQSSLNHIHQHHQRQHQRQHHQRQLQQLSARHAERIVDAHNTLRAQQGSLLYIDSICQRIQVRIHNQSEYVDSVQSNTA